MSSEDPTSIPNTPATPYEARHLANLAAALKQDQHPTQIGPYRIIDIIGEGGMGTVYKAEQDSPIQRTVALKVIKAGMDTRAVLDRFESERKALELMDHTNVARVLDAGTTDSGRPYFVMEFVDGSPITTYADEHRLSVFDRLRLMSQACEAVQHAHQKAIIHRDLKPSNILVSQRDGAATLKVIDFGVAKAIDQSSTARTLFTEVGQLVGTPEYMSPEQADGDRDIDTRTDVYSLGVVLYELLSGSLPFDSKTLRSAGYGEVCRIIREVDPPRPSAKLSSLGERRTTIADQRQSSPALLAQQLRSELDWIVIKSLRKDRDSRYASPHEITQDIENYLAHRPLRAGPESVVYRAKKFVRRNKSGVVSAAAAVALLLVGIAATSWQAVRATRAEKATRAEQVKTLEEKSKAEAAQKTAEDANTATAKVNEFLKEMLESVDPDNAQGKPILVRDVVDRAAADVGMKFKDQPKVESEVRSALGGTYTGLAIYPKADEHLTAAWHLHEKLEGSESREALFYKQRVASVRLHEEKLEEAAGMMNEVLAKSREKFGSDDKLTIDTSMELAVIEEQLGDLAQAEQLLRQALAGYEKIGLGETSDYYSTLGELAQLLRPLGRLDEAEPLMSKALQGIIKLKGADSPMAIDLLGTYSDFLRLRGKLPEAEQGMREYMERAERVYGRDHARAIPPEQGLALVLDLEGKHDEALAHYRSALDRARKVLGPDDGETLSQTMTLAASRSNNGDYEEANQLFHEAYEGWVRTVGPDHPDAVGTLYGLVQNLFHLERWEEAIGPGKTLYEQLLDPKHIQISPARRARFLSGYGVALAHSGRLDEAVGPLIVAYKALLQQDIHSRGNIEAYLSVVEVLVSIETIKDRPAQLAYWQNELVRFGPATRPTHSTTLPSTVPVTSAPTSMPSTTSAP